MIKGERRSLEGKKLDNVAYNTPNLLLRFLRYEPGNRKINIICPGIHMKVSRVDNMIIRCDKVKRLFELEDYDLPYGDIMEMYLSFRAKKLDDVSKEIAKLINNDEVFEKYTSIVLIGVGEGGLYIVNAAKILQRTVRIATIATPFQGTLMADPIYVNFKAKGIFDRFAYEEIKREYHLPNTILGRKKDITGIQYSHLSSHRWINFVSTSKKYGLTPRSRLAKKVFGSYDNDELITVTSQSCKRKELNHEFEIRASHENALLKALEYFRS